MFEGLESDLPYESSGPMPVSNTVTYRLCTADINPSRVSFLVEFVTLPLITLDRYLLL